VRVALHALRDAATDAFFAAQLTFSRAVTLQRTIDAIQARRELLLQRVEQGAALRSEAAALDAEWLRLIQEFREADADHRTAVRVLTLLTGLEIAPYSEMESPGDALAFADDVTSVDTAGRPEFQRYASARNRAVAESRLAAAGALPAVRLFGQAGVGRPDPFRPFENSVDPFAVVGVRAAWTVFDWGRSRRQAEAAMLQARVVESEAEAFASTLERAVLDARADIRRLVDSAELDDQVVDLREQVLAVAQAQFEEGVLNAAEYADRLLDLQEARLTRDRHRIELAYARARVLSALGRFPGEAH
jgi:outer membrane protein TolC